MRSKISFRTDSPVTRASPVPSWPVRIGGCMGTSGSASTGVSPGAWTRPSPPPAISDEAIDARPPIGRTLVPLQMPRIGRDGPPSRFITNHRRGGNRCLQLLPAPKRVLGVLALHSVRSMGDGPDSMLAHLGAAARDARVARGRHQVQIAAEIGVDQGTIRRFEQGKHWPRDPDAMIAAYARDLDMDPRELWAEAIRRWRSA